MDKVGLIQLKNAQCGLEYLISREFDKASLKVLFSFK